MYDCVEVFILHQDTNAIGFCGHCIGPNLCYGVLTLTETNTEIDKKVYVQLYGSVHIAPRQLYCTVGIVSVLVWWCLFRSLLVGTYR